MRGLGGFRLTKWDPTLILAQIVAMQTTYYLTAGLTLTVFGGLFGYAVMIADDLTTAAQRDGIAVLPV